MQPAQLSVLLLTCLGLAAGTASEEVSQQPDLASILADPAADGYDRTFSRCEVEAEDFQATVTSTAYRVLKGVCNPAELETHLAAMEERFNEKLKELKEILTKHLRPPDADGPQTTRSATGGKNVHQHLTGDTSSKPLYKSEQYKQQASTGKIFNGVYQSADQPDMVQNDYGNDLPYDSSEQRRRMVQNLLPKYKQPSSLAGPPSIVLDGTKAYNNDHSRNSFGHFWTAKRHHSGGASSAHTQAQPKPATYSQARETGRPRDYNASQQRPMGVQRNVARPQQTELAQRSRVPTTVSKWDAPSWKSTTAAQYSGLQKRPRGGGRHVTDTISYLSPTQSAPLSRYSELPAYNDTVYFMNGRKMYSYYWKIQDFDTKMVTWKRTRSLRSSRFYVFHGGYRMVLRLFPNRHGNSVLVRAGLTAGRNDKLLPWPFALPFRLSLLDHSLRPSDMQSRTWRPAREPCPQRCWQRPEHRRRHGRVGRRRHYTDGAQCLGLAVPHRFLRSRRALLDGALLVKLDVFLDGVDGQRGRAEIGRI